MKCNIFSSQQVRRSIICIAFITLILLMFSFALADDGITSKSTASGQCGSSMTWSLSSEGVLSISGSGEMWDFEEGEAPWDEYADCVNAITVNEGVVSVGSYAFSYCCNYSSVELPQSLKLIGCGAFGGSDEDYVELHYEGKLSDFVQIDVEIDEEVWGDFWIDCYEEIYLYIDGTRITEINIPSGVTKINDYIFGMPLKISKITIPVSVKYIGVGAFAGVGGEYWDLDDYSPVVPLYYAGTMNDWLNVERKDVCGDALYIGGKLVENVSIPNNLKEVPAYAFAYSAIKSVTIPEGVEKIGNGAFYRSSITSILLPESLKHIGDSAFCSTSIASIILPDDVISIGGASFARTPIKEIIIPEGITSIGEEAFLYCESLESVHLPSSLKSIGKEVFFGCTKLEGITIPEGVTSIGLSAFAWSGLVSIELPSTVTEINFTAFANCENLKSVIIPKSVISIRSNAFDNIKKKVTIYCPSDSYASSYAIDKGIAYKTFTLQATFIQGNTKIYPTDSLEKLRDLLVCKIELSDDTTRNVTPTLKGTLTPGYNTITASYCGLDTTFRVYVSEVSLESITCVYQQTGKVYPSTPLSEIAASLQTTANYNSGATEVVEPTLSGELKAGYSTLTATYNGKTTTFTVFVSSSELASISASFEQESTVIYTTDTLDTLLPLLNVTAHYTDGTFETVNAELTGTLKAGVSTITATYNGKTTTFAVKVTALTVTDLDIVFTQGNLVVCSGSSSDLLKDCLKVTAIYNNGVSAETQEYKFTSTKVKANMELYVGNVKKSFNVLVSGHNLGDEFIKSYPTAKLKGEIAKSCSICDVIVTIREIPIPKSINVESKTIAIGAGETYQLMPILTPSDSCTKYIYTSKSAAIATVDSNGLVTGVKSGSTTVTIKTETGKSVKVTVKVMALPTAIEFKNIPETMGVGEEKTMELVFTPSKNVATNVTISSDNENVIRVDGKKLIAISEGTASITVSNYKKDYQTKLVTVKAAPTELTFEEESGSKYTIGVKHTFVAKAKDGEFAEITYSVSKTDAKILSIDASGKATPKKAGKATIVATAYNGVTAKLQVEVIAAPTSVKLSASKATLGANGDSATATVTIKPATAVQEFTAVSSSDKIASVAVSGNTITITAGDTTGKATITVKTVNGKSTKFTATVVKEPTASDITFNKDKDATVKVGKTATLAIKFASKFGGTIKSIESSNPEVVSVENMKGKIKGIAAGEAGVTLTLYNNVTKVCHVTVSAVAKKSVEEVKTLPVSFAKGATLDQCEFAEIDADGKLLFNDKFDGNGVLTVRSDDVTCTITIRHNTIESIETDGAINVTLSNADNLESDKEKVACVKDGVLCIRKAGKAHIGNFVVAYVETEEAVEKTECEPENEFETEPVTTELREETAEEPSPAAEPVITEEAATTEIEPEVE